MITILKIFSFIYAQPKSTLKTYHTPLFTTISILRKSWMKLFFTIYLIVVQQLTYTHAIAKDCGVEGHVFKIIEEDILKVIEQRLAGVDIHKLNAELRSKTEKYIENPPSVKGISKARETKISYFDPTYSGAEDIYDHNGLLLQPAGKVINPLEHVPLREALIFIDGDDVEQVDYALSYKNAKIILVKGSPLKLQRTHKRWIYFDQAGVITTKLGIVEVPALVEQDGLRLKITIGGGDE
jgi:conjugal transfer pilus assembly protein TraW